MPHNATRCSPAPRCRVANPPRPGVLRLRSPTTKGAGLPEVFRPGGASLLLSGCRAPWRAARPNPAERSTTAPKGRRLAGCHLPSYDKRFQRDASGGSVTAGFISLRGVAVHNLKEVDLDIPHRRLVVALRAERQRQNEPGPRHAVCRGAAAVHRQLFGLHAAVSGAAGKAGGRADRRHSAGHRRHAQEHQPLQPLDRRHHHRDERLPAAAVRQDRPRLLLAMRPGSAPPHARKRRPRSC